MTKKIVKSDEDCAECLCRVCARNEYNDAYNEKVEWKDCVPCRHCRLGESVLIDTDEDCQAFCPDYLDE